MLVNDRPFDADAFSRIVRRNEGSTRRAFVGTQGNPTIGEGFNLNKAGARDRIEALGLDFDAVVGGSAELSDEQASLLSGEDRLQALEDARGLVPVFDDLAPARQVALADMAFNMGRTKLSGFKNMLAAVEQGDFLLAAAEVQNSLYARQVGDRARRNAQALLTGKMSAFGPPSEALAVTLDAVVRNDPARAAENRRIAKEGQLPLPVVEAAPEEADALQRRREMDKLLVNSPVTEEMMSDPRFAEIAHPDLENLTTFERLARAFETGMLLNELGGLGQELRATGATELSPRAKEVQGRIEKLAGADEGLISWFEAAAEIAGQQVAIFAQEQTAVRVTGGAVIGGTLGAFGGPLAPATVPAGTALGAAAGFASQFVTESYKIEGGLAYIEYIEGGMDSDTASWMAMGAGTINAALETASATVLLAPFAKAGQLIMKRTIRESLLKPGVQAAAAKAAKAYGSVVAAEVSTEVMQEGVTMALGEIGDRLSPSAFESPSMEEAAKRMAEIAEKTFKAMVFFALPGAGATVVSQRVQSNRAKTDLANARRSRAAMDRLNEVAEASTLAGVAPDLAAQHQAVVLRSNGVDTVSIRADKVMEWAQAREGGAVQALRDLGVADQMDDALFGESTVEVEVEQFASEILGTAGYEALADHVKVLSNVATFEEAAVAAGEVAADLVTELERSEFISETLKKKAKKVLEELTAAEPEQAAAIITRASPGVQVVLENLVEGVRQRKIDVSDIQAKGRVRELDKRMAELDRQIVEVSDKIEARETKGPFATKAEREAAGPETGKPTTALRKKLSKLVDQREAQEQEQADILLPRRREALLEPEAAKPTPLAAPLAKKEVSVKGEVLEKISRRATREAVRAVRLGFKEGLRIAKRDVKAAQTALLAVIKKSGLDGEQRAKFSATVKNVQTFEQLKERLPVIEARIAVALEKQGRKKAKAKLKKVLQKTKARKQAGRPVGKFDADTQVVLDMARDIMRLSVGDAQTQLLAGVETDTPVLGTALHNRLLAVAANSNSITAADVEQLAEDLDSLKQEGRAAGKERLTRRQKTTRRLVENASDAVTQGEGIEEVSTVGIAKRIRARMRETKSELGALHNAWDELLDIVFNKRGVDDVAFIQSLRMTRPLQRVKARGLRWEARLDELGIAAFGVKNQKQLRARLYEDSERQDLGRHVDVNGRVVQLQYRKDEARKLWMELQDETIAPTITHEQGNAYTEDMVQAIIGLLDERDLAYAQAQLDFYREIYPEINAVYRRLYGVNLPFNEFYSPIQRDKGAASLEKGGDALGNDSVFGQEMPYRRSISGELKSRVPNIFPLMRRSDVGTMHRYMHDMAHFVETAEQAQLLNAVFSNPRLRKEVAARHGKSMVRQFDSQISDFTVGYIRRGTEAERVVGTFNRLFARSVLAAKVTIGLKQLTSFFAMAEGMPVKDFIAGTIDFVRHPKKAVKVLYNSSPLLQARGSSIDFELAKIGSQTDILARWRHAQTMDNLLMSVIRLGDRIPIYVGGWAKYRYLRGQGIGHEEAIAQVEDITAATQQSVDVDKMSSIQRAGPIGRTFSMFMTARLSLFRGELRAIRQFSRGKITAAEFGKRMAIYHFIMPSLVQAIASGFRFDRDDQLKALLLGQLNTFLIFGDILADAVYTAISDEEGFRFDESLPIAATVREVWDGVRQVLEDGATTEEVLEGFGELLDAAGKFTGKPVEQARNIFAGGLLLTEGKTEEGAKRILGFSPKVAAESSKPETDLTGSAQTFR